MGEESRLVNIFLTDIESMNPPSELEEVHKDYVTWFKAFSDLWDERVEIFSEARTLEQALGSKRYLDTNDREQRILFSDLEDVCRRMWDHIQRVENTLGQAFDFCGYEATSQSQPGDVEIDCPIAQASLRAGAQARGIRIGSAVRVVPLLENDCYSKVLSREFNMLTPENAMKFERLYPEEYGDYDFNDANAIVNFAESNGMEVRGHPLVWYDQLPDWLEYDNGDEREWSRKDLIKVLEEHIKTVVREYKGRIRVWDVVNEAFFEDGTWRIRDKFNENGSVKEKGSIWARVIGPEYIEIAFRAARVADSDALLFYNDFNGEGLGDKSAVIFDLVAGLLRQGVPIDGVGLQMHFAADNPPDFQSIRENMERLAQLGLKVHITEIDVRIDLRIKGRASDADLETQARIYQEALETCLAVEACDTFVMWGFTDRYSWIPESKDKVFEGYGSALIFDKAFRPKRAYRALSSTIQAQTSPSSCSNVTEIPTLECEALVALFNATDGPNWWNKSGWLETDTPCSWHGVTCNANHVIQLVLFENQLSGSIPAELGNLSSLFTLGLNDNQLLTSALTTNTVRPELVEGHTRKPLKSDYSRYFCRGLVGRVGRLRLTRGKASTTTFLREVCPQLNVWVRLMRLGGCPKLFLNSQSQPLLSVAASQRLRRWRSSKLIPDLRATINLLRPGRVSIVFRVVGKPDYIGPSRVHDVDFKSAVPFSMEGDPGAVRRPRGSIVLTWAIGQPRYSGAIGVNQVYFQVVISVRGEGNPGAIG